MDKMAERELGGRSGNVGVNDSLFRYLLKKKKKAVSLMLSMQSWVPEIIW